jgi:ribonuclease D
VPDGSLVVAAKALPTSKRELAAIKEFTGRASRSQLDRWFDAIQRGMTTDDLPVVRPPSDSLPPPRVWSEKNPEADGRLRRARTAVTEVAADLNLPVENLLTPEFLRRVAWAPPEPITAHTVAGALEELGARPWQLDAIAQVIADAFVNTDQTPEDAEKPAS